MKKILVFVLILLTVAIFTVSAKANSEDTGKAQTVATEDFTGNIVFPSVLVDDAWVAERLNASNLVILDSARDFDEYRNGHLPGALYAKDEGYRATINGISNMFPGVEETVSWLRELGISNDSAVLVYDSGNSLWASRVAWTLAYLGHKNWAVLNGGWNLWKAEGYETEKGTVEPGLAGTFTADVQDKLLVTGDQVFDNLYDEGTIIVDARSQGEYDGTDVRANRGGHIPGALLVEWTENNTSGDFPVMLGPDELAEFYNSEHITPDKEIVTLCQTGIRGAVSWLALTLAGYENVALYDGSWLEWANNDKYPVEQ